MLLTSVERIFKQLDHFMSFFPPPRHVLNESVHYVLSSRRGAGRLKALQPPIHGTSKAKHSKQPSWSACGQFAAKDDEQQ